MLVPLFNTLQGIGRITLPDEIGGYGGILGTIDKESPTNILYINGDIRRWLHQPIPDYGIANVEILISPGGGGIYPLIRTSVEVEIRDKSRTGNKGILVLGTEFIDKFLIKRPKTIKWIRRNYNYRIDTERLPDKSKLYMVNSGDIKELSLTTTWIYP